RFRLAIPQRLLFDFGGGQFGDALEGEDGVPEVRDGGVAVLEVEALQEFLRVVGAHPFDGITNGIGRPAVAGQRVGTLLGRHGRHGDDAFGGGQDAIITKCRSGSGASILRRIFPNMPTGLWRMQAWICARWNRLRWSPAFRKWCPPGLRSSCRP